MLTQREYQEFRELVELGISRGWITLPLTPGRCVDRLVRDKMNRARQARRQEERSHGFGSHRLSRSRFSPRFL